MPYQLPASLVAEARDGDLQSDGESEDGVTTQDLNGPGSHVDLCSSQIGTLETLDIARTGDLGPFQLCGVDDQCQSGLDLDIGSTADLS